MQCNEMKCNTIQTHAQYINWFMRSDLLGFPFGPVMDRSNPPVLIHSGSHPPGIYRTV